MSKFKFRNSSNSFNNSNFNNFNDFDSNLSFEAEAEPEFKDLTSSALREELEFLMRRARLINRELTSRMISCPWEPAPWAPANTKTKRQINENQDSSKKKALTGVPEIDELPIKYRRAFLLLAEQKIKI